MNVIGAHVPWNKLDARGQLSGVSFPRLSLCILGIKQLTGLAWQALY